MRVIARLSMLAALVLSCGQLAAGPVAAADQMTVSGKFKEKPGKGSNLSGMDCLAPGRDGTRLCLLVDDELKVVQFARLEGLELVVGEDEKVFKAGRTPIGKPPHELLHLAALHCSAGRDDGELDGEAVAHAGMTFFVVGSHGCSKKGEYRSEQFFLARIEVDGNGAIQDFKISYRLSKVISDNETLAGSFGQNLPRNRNPDPAKEADLPPAGNGTSIEAMAAVEDPDDHANDRLVFGFRSPAEPDAILLDVPLAGLFDDGVALEKSTAHLLALGEKIGFRDLEALPGGGFLALTGPDREADPDEPYALQRVTAGFALDGNAVPVAADGEGSPEAIESLGTIADGHLRVAIISDGKPNGGPVLIDIAQ